MTAYDRFEYAQNAIRVRALEYLLKPYDDEELLAAVESAIHRPLHGRAAPPAAEPADDGTDPRADMAAAVAARMLDFIRTHYQQEISMQDAARALNYSEPYFCRIFKQQFGRSFTAYLSAYRVERGAGAAGPAHRQHQGRGQAGGLPRTPTTLPRCSAASPAKARRNIAPAGCKMPGGAAPPRTGRLPGTKTEILHFTQTTPPTFGQNVGGVLCWLHKEIKYSPFYKNLTIPLAGRRPL